MRMLIEIMIGLFLAVILLVSFFAIAMGFSEPTKNGSLMIGGCILAGSTVIALAVMNSGGRDRD
jgi:hypothetical protein